MAGLKSVDNFALLLAAITPEENAQAYLFFVFLRNRKGRYQNNFRILPVISLINHNCDCNST